MKGVERTRSKRSKVKRPKSTVPIMVLLDKSEIERKSFVYLERR